ncbi:hybrid sensor histidine kinase/response regulator [Roseospira visakhapatnamensis]|uniref:histidine kinase n=1 Tax=Roseospira visakhapatnamensis TaxID=390880 RepID=A0A7W6RED5_9PROT|nr:hybrid sensor histidine kinase/response regulator [Roseospira visakhapatnamensis]MBB4266489.1 PAS domain S-box-containing protein [Roseospira visakhapatnamensis]
MTDLTKRILVVEDNPGDVDLIREYLDEADFDHVVDHAPRLADAIIELRSDVPPGAVLLDLGLPDGMGIDTLRRILDAAGDVPILVLTGRDDRELAVRTMQEGAQDYLVKDGLTPDGLTRALRRAMERVAQDRLHRQTEEALRQSEDRFRSAFLTAPYGMALVAPDGRFMRVNHALCDLLGYTEPEVLAGDVQTFTHPEDCDADGAHIAGILAGDAVSYALEKRFVRKGGQVVWVHVSVSLVRSWDGSPVHFVMQVLDLSQRKDLEQRLLQAQKMEAVGQLTGGLAHDFNNLLGVITGNLELLLRSVRKDDRAFRRAQAAYHAALRGADLTRQMLAFSRRQILEVKDIDARALLEGLVGLLRRTLGEAVELRLKQANSLWSIRTDGSQLESAILNLALNARDAMPQGGHLTIETMNVHLDAEYAARDHDVVPGDYVLVAVSDTGTGIPAEIIDRVFEPFFTTKEVGKGTGLGLSMVFGFAKQSGGHIKVYSEGGRGTVVKLFLPRSKGTVGDAAATADEPDDDGAPFPATVLVVDDREDLRMVAAEMLEDLGYTVMVAESGPAALLMLARNRAIDLLLTDIVMPGGMSGPQLAQAARDRWPRLPILFMSGYAEGAILREGQIGTEHDLISKPFRRADLARKVRAALLNGPGAGTS